MGRMDPKQMQNMMRQLGIQSSEVKATRVVIETEGKHIVIENPSVTAIEMQGQKTYTIAGTEQTQEMLSQEDIELVAEQGKVSEVEARKALENSKGDIAQAIARLKN